MEINMYLFHRKGTMGPFWLFFAFFPFFLAFAPFFLYLCSMKNGNHTQTLQGDRNEGVRSKGVGV